MTRTPARPEVGVRPSVRARRIEYGLTLVRLAGLCAEKGVRVSASELSRIERRIHSPRPALRKALADLLDVPFTDI